MFVVEVVPLSRKMPFDTLLYTSRESHSIGDLVSVPFQDSAISAIIVTIHDLTAVKSHIRSLPYRIKEGIDTVQEDWIPAYICSKLVDYAKKHVIPLTNIFQLFWDQGAPIFDKPLSDNYPPPTGIVGSMAERARNFGRPSSWQGEGQSEIFQLIVCPSTEHARAMTRHIPNSIVVSTQAQLSKYFSKPGYRFEAQEDGKEKLQNRTTIIPNILFPKILPTLPSTTPIIFDGILSPQFQRRAKDGSFFHHAVIYINLAYWLGHPVTIGDELLQFGDYKTLWSTIPEYKVLAPIIASEAVQVKNKKKRTLETHHLTQLSQQAMNGKSILIYCNQRDLFGYVCCPKCQYIERCETCTGIVRLVIDGSRHMLECTTCQVRARARDICRSCGGITLESRRQGIEGYTKKIREIAPGIPVTSFTKETQQTASVLRKWMETGGILITTSTIFAYPQIYADTIYIAPHTWTSAPDTPEEFLYEYLWLLHHSKQLVSLPITREILTQSSNDDLLNIRSRAESEYSSAEQYNLPLSGTIL